MLDEKKLSQAIDYIIARFDEVNSFFIAKVAEQVKKIGELNASSIHRIAIMTEMGANITDITQRLQLAAGMSVKDVMQLYQTALDDTYTDPRFRVALQHRALTAADRARLTQYTQAVSAQTAQQIVNLSNTTAITVGYKAVVDKAVLAASSGLTDYRSAMRQSIRDLGHNGMQVQYESGYHRRLDTAVRQNIIDGTNQIAQHCSLMMGEALDFDAVEISAHARSAPDHEPVQGRVFLKAEFENMQAGLPFRDVDGKKYEAFRRPIGEWNCMHIVMSFSTQHSVRRYTDQQLAQWAADNAKGCVIGKKHYTTYAASQLMRKIETEIRREKDAAVAAQKAGDSVLRRECQERINALSKEYTGVAAASGIAPRRQRMMVEGFRAVKIKQEETGK